MQYSPKLLLRLSATLAVGLGASQLLGLVVVLLHPSDAPSSFREWIPSIVTAAVPLAAGLVELLRPNIAVLAGAHGWILGRLPHLLQPLSMPLIPPQALHMMLAHKDTVYVIGLNDHELALISLALIGLLLCAIAEAKNRSAGS